MKTIVSLLCLSVDVCVSPSWLSVPHSRHLDLDLCPPGDPFSLSLSLHCVHVVLVSLPLSVIVSLCSPSSSRSPWWTEGLVAHLLSLWQHLQFLTVILDPVFICVYNLSIFVPSWLFRLSFICRSIEYTSLVGLPAIDLSSVALSVVSSVLLILRLFLRKQNIYQGLFSAIHIWCSSQHL